MRKVLKSLRNMIINILEVIVSFFITTVVASVPLKILIFFLVLFLIVLIINLIQQEFLEVTDYTVTSEKIENDIKIVFISDLHLREFGNGNERLLQKIKEQKPDIIAIGGDFVIKIKNEYKTAIDILPKLCEIAPTYYTLGNHELMNPLSEEIIREIQQTDVILLDNEVANITVNENNITLCGLNMFTDTDVEDENYEAFTGLMTDFSSEKNYKLLLCHYPHYSEWYFEKEKFSYDFDLMLSGHTHGGDIIIPFIGGIIAPNQGFFPKYDFGEFDLENYKMIITRGLGDSFYWIRTNNVPEIVVINLKNNKN